MSTTEIETRLNYATGKVAFVWNGNSYATRDEAEEAQRRGPEKMPPSHAEIEKMAAGLVLTTCSGVAGRTIEREIDIVGAECVFGMNAIRDVMNAVRDFAGGRSGTIEQLLREARETCAWEIRAAAFQLGADAVVGVRTDHSEISGGGKGMLFVTMTGTAVKLAGAEHPAV
ncbi:MAG TPA: heavy metal-binding domain-containing protein [Kaistia sp.]|nr:heavy metal-binding domain-containing protein [Kaistia sp.]